MIGRIIGCLLLIVAAVALVRDALDFYDSGRLALLAGDQLWFSLFPTNFDETQRWGADTLGFFWDPIITGILSVPVFVVTGLLGVLFLLGSRKRRRRPGRRRPIVRGTAS